MTKKSTSTTETLDRARRKVPIQGSTTPSVYLNTYISWKITENYAFLKKEWISYVCKYVGTYIKYYMKMGDAHRFFGACRNRTTPKLEA